MLTLRARIQQIPPDHKGGYDLEVDEIVAEADDYDTALAKAKQELPDGWRIIWLRSEPAPPSGQAAN